MLWSHWRFDWEKICFLTPSHCWQNSFASCGSPKVSVYCWRSPLALVLPCHVGFSNMTTYPMAACCFKDSEAVSLAPLLARWSYTMVFNAILAVTSHHLCDILWVLPKFKGQGLLVSTLKSVCHNEFDTFEDNFIEVPQFGFVRYLLMMISKLRIFSQTITDMILNCSHCIVSGGSSFQFAPLFMFTLFI